MLDSPDALGAVQDAHWQIQRAHCDYQHAAEERRQLAADSRRCHPCLRRRAGSERPVEGEARDANSAIEHVATVDPDGDTIGEILTRCQGP